MTVNSQFHKGFTSIKMPLIAGSNISESLTSADDGYLISVNILPNTVQNNIYNTWHIQVRRNDLSWHPNLNIHLQRTGEGDYYYANTLSGASEYISISSINQTFINGRGWIDNIPFQLKITGISATLPAKSYSTEIVFTLIDD